MRIAIPAWSVDAGKGGTRTYLTNVVEALSQRDDVSVTVLVDQASTPVFEPFAEGGRVGLVPFDLPGRRVLRPITEQLRAGRLDEDLADVLLVPSNVGLLRARIPQAVVVQSPLAVPSIRRAHADLARHGFAHRLYHRTLLGPTLRRAGAVVAVSDWLRRELLASIPGLARDRVHTVLEGVRVPADLPVRAPGETTGRILFVSTLFPYKGAELLVDALGELHRTHPELAWTCELVGRDPSGGATTEALEARARAEGVSARVAVAGHRPHDEVWRLYADADVFVYPSLLETFGLPPLEAMAVGTATVVSDAPSVAEVVGGAAVVVDPTDASALAEALHRLLTAPDERARLGAGGRRRAEVLTWDATAEGLVEVLRRLVPR